VSVTVNGPLDKVVNISGTLQSGGSLDANTTYYIRIGAKEANTHSNHSPYRQSPASDEYSITTTATEKSIQLSWDAVADAACYNVYFSTSPLTLDSESMFLRWASANNATPTCTTNSVTIDGSQYVSNKPWDRWATFQVGHAALDAGVLTLEVSGTVTIGDIYDAIVAAGYSDYVGYNNAAAKDGVNYFYLSGSILTASSGSVDLTITNHILVLDYGGIQNTNASATVTLGELDGNNTKRGCVVALNFLPDAGYINLYNVVFQRNLFNFEYAANDGNYIAYFNSGNYKDLLFQAGSPELNNGYIKDSTVINAGQIYCYRSGGGENYNTKFVACYFRLWSAYADPVAFRECEFSSNVAYLFYTRFNGDATASPVELYDNTYNDDLDNFVNWKSSSQRYFDFYHNVQFIVEDENGVIENAQVILTRNDSTEIINEMTDVNGETTAVDVLIKRLEHNLAGGAGYGADKNTWTNYTFTLSVTKAGYTFPNIPIVFDAKTVRRVVLVEEQGGVSIYVDL